MTFGIYPGGAVGTIGPGVEPKPEDAGLRMAALRELRGSSPFVVHLYDAYRGPADASALPSGLAEQIRAYTDDGFQVEVVLAYRPARSTGDVAGFVDYVRRRVRQLGTNPRITGVQVTNEANVNGSASATDGFFPGAKDALVQGVVAAAAEAASRGAGQLGVGFNWAYQTGPGERSFWSYLAKRGGARFAEAVDWVGLDVYPGTWGPPLPEGDLAAGVGAYTRSALGALRATYMPLARLSASVPIHVCETGYPTGPGRSDADQVIAMRSLIGAVRAVSAEDNVSDLRWFDLRDADSSSSLFEARYGIMCDDYTPRPAFAVFRDLIAAGG